MSIMNIVDIAQIASALAAVGSFVGSIIVYKRSVNRECKLETLRKLTELRMKYPSKEEISNNDKLDYIKELEFFATGINQKIYDYCKNTITDSLKFYLFIHIIPKEINSYGHDKYYVGITSRHPNPR